MAKYINREEAIHIVTKIMCDNKVHHKGRAINRNLKQLSTINISDSKSTIKKKYDIFDSIIEQLENDQQPIVNNLSEGLREVN